MGKKYFYLEATDKAPSEAEAKKPATNGETSVEAQQQTTKSLDDSQKTHMQKARFHAGEMAKEVNAARKEFVEKKKSQMAEKKAAKKASENNIQNASADLLDEENDDASIVSDKSKEEEIKDAKGKTLSEKDKEEQPLNELFSLINVITKN